MGKSLRSQTKYRGNTCLNCEVPLDILDKYCHQCGQLNTVKRLALKDFFNEFFSNAFSYDSRLWKTIKSLLFKPGYVSKSYIEGQRQNFANPFRFFLSVCIIYFVLIQIENFVEPFLNTSTEDFTNPDLEDEENASYEMKLDGDGLRLERISESDYDLEETENGLSFQRKSPQNAATDSISQEVLMAKKLRSQKVDTTYMTQAALDSLSVIPRIFIQLDQYKRFYSQNNTHKAQEALATLGHDDSKLNRTIYERGILYHNIEDNPGKLVDIILPKLPIFFFLFTPFITLFLWLLYVRRKFTYMEHLIFSFNVLTFIFLSMILMLFIKWISFGYIVLTGIFFGFIGPFYLYKAMRNFYGQKRFKTIIKFLLISFVYSIGLILGMALLLIVGIAFF
ncbi:MAG: DUF3667 domain-containing protein [Nonlabens sp.]|uniref:DUF3667 domain-containing protein n=1 Tax=Nonlabens sp. TaxID=1888209 RepID=UPI003EFA7752